MQLFKELGIARYFMLSLGLWKLTEDSSLLLKYLKYLVNLWIWFNILFMLIPVVTYVLFEDLSLSVRFKLMVPVLYAVNNLAKYFLLVSRVHGIGDCLEHVSEDW